LIGALRGVLKARKTTYAMLAKKLGVSEATIKRFFTSDDGSVGRVAEICDALSISFADLVEQARSHGESTFTLTYEQEAFFAENPSYFAFFKQLVDAGLTPKEICTKHRLSAHSLPKYLRRLEGLGLVDWLAGDRVRLKVRGTQNWLSRGPLVKKFLHAENLAFLAYLEENFDRESHLFTSSTRRMHPETLRTLNMELRSLFASYRARVYRDEVFYPPSELVDTKWLLGLAPFQATDVKITDL
jgi:DNA-binding Xre family transcriptional regulator